MLQLKKQVKEMYRDTPIKTSSASMKRKTTDQIKNSFP